MAGRFATGGHTRCHGFVPERLTALRTEAGLTAKSLAALMGRAADHGSQIRGWERGHHVPSDHNVNELARALGVSRADLMEDR